MKLYHATYQAYMDSIFAEGLGAQQLKNWDFSMDNVVCLADDIDLTHEEIADLIAFGIERFPSLKENKVKAPLESKIEFASNRTAKAQSTDIAAVKTSAER